MLGSDSVFKFSLRAVVGGYCATRENFIIYIKKDGLEEIKASLVPYMHDSMLYKLNIVEDKETAVDFKQDSSNIGSESNTDMDIDMFDT